MQTSIAAIAPLPAVHSGDSAARKPATVEAPKSDDPQDFSDTMEESTKLDPSSEMVSPERALPEKSIEKPAMTVNLPSEPALGIHTAGISDTAAPTGQPEDTIVDAGPTAKLRAPSEEPMIMRTHQGVHSKESAPVTAPMPVAQGKDEGLLQTRVSQGKPDSQIANPDRPLSPTPAASPLEPKHALPQTSSVTTAGPPIEIPAEHTRQEPQMNGKAPAEIHAPNHRSASERSVSPVPAVTPEPVAPRALGSDVAPAPAPTDTAPIKLIDGQGQAQQLTLPEALTVTNHEPVVRETERVDRIGLDASPQPSADTSKTMLRPAPEQVRGISLQLTEAVQRSQDGSIDISLRPEELGRLRMSLQPGDGTMHVILQAERAETMDLLRRHIATLQQEFLALGYENFSFEFSSSAQSHSESAPETQDDAGEEDDGSITAAAGPSPHAAHRYAGGLDLRV